MAQFDLSITLEYDLVSASHKLQLVEEVRKWISQGWQPLGGAFAYEDEIHQTMVRERITEPLGDPFRRKALEEAGWHQAQ